MQQPIPSKLGIWTTSSFHRGDGHFANRRGCKQCQWQRKEDIFYTEEGKTNTHTPSCACPLPWQRPSCVTEQQHFWSSETSGRNPELYIYDLALSLFLVKIWLCIKCLTCSLHSIYPFSFFVFFSAPKLTEIKRKIPQCLPEQILVKKSPVMAFSFMASKVFLTLAAHYWTLDTNKPAKIIYQLIDSQHSKTTFPWDLRNCFSQTLRTTPSLCELVCQLCSALQSGFQNKTRTSDQLLHTDYSS